MCLNVHGTFESDCPKRLKWSIITALNRWEQMKCIWNEVSFSAFSTEVVVVGRQLMYLTFSACLFVAPLFDRLFSHVIPRKRLKPFALS